MAGEWLKLAESTELMVNRNVLIFTQPSCVALAMPPSSLCWQVPLLLFGPCSPELLIASIFGNTDLNRQSSCRRCAWLLPCPFRVGLPECRAVGRINDRTARLVCLRQSQPKPVAACRSTPGWRILCLDEHQISREHLRQFGSAFGGARGRGSDGSRPVRRVSPGTSACWASKVRPSHPPSLGDALNAGYLYLEVRCLGCNTHQTVPLKHRPATKDNVDP